MCFVCPLCHLHFHRSNMRRLSISKFLTVKHLDCEVHRLGSKIDDESIAFDFASCSKMILSLRALPPAPCNANTAFLLGIVDNTVIVHVVAAFVAARPRPFSFSQSPFPVLVADASSLLEDNCQPYSGRDCYAAHAPPHRGVFDSISGRPATGRSFWSSAYDCWSKCAMHRASRVLAHVALAEQLHMTVVPGV